MKYLVSTVMMMCLSLMAVMAAPDKKHKVLDSYFIDSDGYVCDVDFARYEVKVLQEADSIKVYTYNRSFGRLASIETYKTLNDSVQVKWGTQMVFDISGALYRMQNIDLVRGIEETVQYGDSDRVVQEIYKDNLNNVTKSLSYYPNGQKKVLSETLMTFDKKYRNRLISWYANGKLMREQTVENGKTVLLKTYDSDGEPLFALPCQDGDSVFYTIEGNITSRKKAVRYGVVRLEADSIKITSFDNRGRKVSVENYMSYNPVSPVSWGVQEYFYTSTAQPTDSVRIFRSVLGDNLQENTYYEDGKLKSSSTIIYNNVMVADRVFKQYYPSGILRRIEKHHGDKLVEGHIYDTQGNEVLPFYEFKP